MNAEQRRAAANAIRFALLAVLALAAVMQFFPAPRANPPSDPANSFEAVVQPTREVAMILNRACHDCHSNGTRWPWYSSVWPASWMVTRDVRQGRLHINFSEWRGIPPDATRQRMAGVCEEVSKGDMPPLYYRPLHPQARLSRRDVSALCAVTTGRR